MSKHRMTFKQKQEMVDTWNLDNPVGTPVVVRKDDGSQVETKTRSKAQLLYGRTPVIWVDGIAGCYALERIERKGAK